MNQQLPQQPRPISPAPPADDTVDLQKLFFRFLRNWYWLALGLLAGGLVAFLVLRYSTTIYQVSGTVLIADKQQNTFSTEAIVSELGYTPGTRTGSKVSDELQILKSSDLMRSVVDSLGLHVHYVQEGRIKDSELYLDSPLSVILTDSLAGRISLSLRLRPLDQQDYLLISGGEDTLSGRFGVPIEVNGVPLTLKNNGQLSMGSFYQVNLQASDAVARSLAGGLSLNQVESSSVIRVSMQGAVPQKLQDIISTLVQVYNQRTLSEKNEAGENTLAFIDERLRFITRELYDVEREVEGFKKSNDMAVDLSSRAQDVLGQLQTLDQQKTELELQQQMLSKIRAYLELDEFRSLPVSEEMLGGTTNQLVQEYNQLIFDRENLLETATPENPTVTTYEEQLAYLRDNILLALDTRAESLQARLEVVSKRIRPLEQQIARVPRNERQLLQIMRQQQIKEQLFLFLLQKREETALSIAAQTPDARMLDRPVNRGPVSPQPTRIYLLSCLLGIALPAGGILLRHFTDNKIRSREDIEGLTALPFLGSIAESKKDHRIVVRKGSRSSVAEMFRLLRTNLRFNAAGAESQVILVTSSVSGEGKTFISINLGASLALSGKKVLLLGLDLRKPKMSRYITGTDEGRGITNYLVGAVTDIDQLIQPVPEYDNLDYLSCGPLPPNPAELLMTNQLRQAIETFRQRYDHIIIDTSPVGLVTDAVLLEAEVDQSLVVTRFGVTITAHVRMLDELYREKKLPRMGLVLNGVNIRRGYGYGKYSYGYGYGYGYYSDDQKRKWWRFWR